MKTLLLLICSHIFMTIAWYGDLKYLRSPVSGLRGHLGELADCLRRGSRRSRGSIWARRSLGIKSWLSLSVGGCSVCFVAGRCLVAIATSIFPSLRFCTEAAKLDWQRAVDSL